MCRVGGQDPFLVFFRGGIGYFPEDLRKIGAVVEATFHGDLGHFGAFLRQPVLGGGDAGDGNIIVQPHAGDLFEQLGKVTGADSVFSGKKIQGERLTVVCADIPGGVLNDPAGFADRCGLFLLPVTGDQDEELTEKELLHFLILLGMRVTFLLHGAEKRPEAVKLLRADLDMLAFGQHIQVLPVIPARKVVVKHHQDPLDVHRFAVVGLVVDPLGDKGEIPRLQKIDLVADQVGGSAAFQKVQLVVIVKVHERHPAADASFGALKKINGFGTEDRHGISPLSRNF